MKSLKTIILSTLIAAGTTICLNTNVNAMEQKTTNNMSDKLNDWCQQGTTYFLGKSVKKDLNTARKYFKSIIETPNAESINLDAYIQALRLLGRIHYCGNKKIQKNIWQADLYFNILLAIPNIKEKNFIAWIDTMLHHCTICFQFQNYPKAKESCENIISEISKTTIKHNYDIALIDTYLILGKINYFGLDIPQNLSEAKQFFQKVLLLSKSTTQNQLPQQLEAKLFLGKICYKLKKYPEAYSHLAEITTMENAKKINPSVFNEALIFLAKVRKEIDPNLIQPQTTNTYQSSSSSFSNNF